MTQTMWRENGGVPGSAVGEHVHDMMQQSPSNPQHSRDAFCLLDGSLLSVQEEERRRLARELHDDLTQRLAVLAIDIGKLAHALGAVPVSVQGALWSVQEQVAELAADVHGLSRQLHPSILDDLGLVDAIRSQCDYVMRREGLQVTYEFYRVPDVVSPEVALGLYRIVQEALRNIVRHACAEEAGVALHGENDTLVLRITDTGQGFVTSKVKKGLGLVSMAERAQFIGGALSFWSQPGKGTALEVRVPLESRLGEKRTYGA